MKRLSLSYYLTIALVYISGSFSFTTSLLATTGKSFLTPRPTNQDPVLLAALRHRFEDCHCNQSRNYMPEPAPQKKKDSSNNNTWSIWNYFSKKATPTPKAIPTYQHHYEQAPCKHDYRTTLATTFFYEQSFDRKDMARYFFPNNKTELTIDTSPNAETDIWAGWLNIAGKADSVLGTELPFHSKITIKPQHKSFGFILQKKHLLGHHFFIAIDAPCVQVENNLHLREYDVRNAAAINNDLTDGNKGLPGVALNATECFNGRLMKYARITNKTHKLAGIADINLKVGYEIKNDSTHYCDVHLGAIIPMGYKPKAEYLFEPLIGNGRHFGIGIGTEAAYHEGNVSLHVLCEGTYLCKGSELRTFDTRSYGAWSRYVLINKPDLGLLPAVNFLTLKTKVTPRFMLNILGDISVDLRWGSVDIGYNCWARSRDKLRLSQAVEPVLFIDPNTFPQSTAQISVNPHNVNFEKPLTIDDVDINVAANPSQISHTVFGNLNVDGSYRGIPFVWNIGGKGEFVHGNNTLAQWALMSGIKFVI